MIPLSPKHKEALPACALMVFPENLEEVEGITTKIHLLCNSMAQPMDFIITGGNIPDIRIAPVSTSRNKMKTLIAGNAYGAKSYRDCLKEQKVTACIPAKCNEKNPDQHDRQLYKKRHEIENMFKKLKDWKGIAFRGNSCGSSFQAFVSLALIFIFLNAD